MFDIIIVTYNAKEILKKCIHSIEKYTKKTVYKLTVVDNNSTDGTLLYLRKLSRRVCVIETGRNGGFSYGANIGLKKTHNSFIALLDDDIEVTSGWLEGLYSQMKGRKEIGIVGCKIVFPDKRIFSADFSVRRDKRAGFGEIDNGQRDYVKECDALPGPCWLIRREIIEGVGYFDESFFPCQYEDIDYCIRVRLAGYKIIYDGKKKVIHHHLLRSSNRINENRKKFLEKWKSKPNQFPLKDSSPEDKLTEQGIILFKKNNYTGALKVFQKAKAIDKRFVDPHYMGLAFYKKSFYKRAVEEFSEVLSRFPEGHNFTVDAHIYLWLCYKKLGLHKKAEKEARRILVDV